MQYNNSIISFSEINQSIEIFKKLGNKDMLARCYYYKAASLNNLGKRKKAVEYAKKAEANTNNSLLEGKIYNLLSLINSENGNYHLAMNYARKYFSCKAISKKSDKIDCYNRMAISYYYLLQEDSAIFYINQCIPLLNYATDSAKIIYLDNIGYLNMDSNPKLAFKYLNLAMKLGPSPDTYDNLAQIYIKQGKKEKADSLWKEALKTKDISKKSEIIATILKNKQEKGDYKEIAHYASWLVDLKDSLAEQRKNEQILEQQIKFDNEVAQTEQQKTITRLTYVICIILLLLVILCLIIKSRHIKGITEKLENEKKLKEYKMTIEQLASTGTTDQKMIADLQKRIDKLQKYKDTYTHQGNVLYESAMAGKCIKDWNKSEMTTFLDHYITKDIEYSLTLEENEQLTPREKVFLVLLHEGKAEAKIAEMMTLSNSALRTMKSRIKKKQEKR